MNINLRPIKILLLVLAAFSVLSTAVIVYLLNR